MRKINITIVFGGEEDYPACADILGAFPELQVIARPGGLYEPEAWSAIARSDVVLLDEVVLEQDGVETVQRICDSFPLVKMLLILEQGSDQRVLEALSLGIAGVMERTSMVSMLRKAIPALYSGEAWVSRGLMHSLRNRLNKLHGNDYRSANGNLQRGGVKLN